MLKLNNHDLYTMFDESLSFYSGRIRRPRLSSIWVKLRIWIDAIIWVVWSVMLLIYHQDDDDRDSYHKKEGMKQ